jgi:hypothetical protein
VGHDVIEVVAGDETVVVEVSFCEDGVDLFLGEVLSQIMGDLLELVGGDLALG